MQPELGLLLEQKKFLEIIQAEGPKILDQKTAILI